MYKNLMYAACVLLVLLVAAGAQARIVYVDATQGETGNTRLATGEVFNAAPLTTGNDGSGDDGLWRERGGFGNTSIFEAGGDYRNAPYDMEDCPRLVTTVDVPEGDYEVYVYFWDTNSTWGLRASLTDDAGELPLYLPNRAGDPNNPAVAADVNDFDLPQPVVTTSGGRIMWQVYLGTVKATKAIAVYVDDRGVTGDSNQRTWYDGIGFKALKPKINYVDATEGEAGNTALAAGGVFTSTTDGSGSDNLWRGRAFGNEATIFESGGSYGDTANPEDCPRLVTTIAVPENEYAVYALFWSDTSGWRIEASLTDAAGDLPLYVANDPNGLATQADANDFAAPVPMLAEGNRVLWQVFLGNTGTTTSISVFIDDDPNHQTHNARTWYDGIGYKVITPIHYVDATAGDTGNTRLASGDVLVAPDNGTVGSGADNAWRTRAFGNGTIFEARGDYNGNNTEDAPRLATTVDVPENIYEVFAYFWDTNSTWRMRASLTDDVNELPLFVPNREQDPNKPAVAANAADFAAAVPIVATADGRVMWQAPLGMTGMTTKITVYVDDDTSTDPANGGNFRTWYDGIGYKVASLYTPDIPPKPPEPEPEEPLPEPVDPGIAGLVAYYAFEGNVDDLSGNGLNGTIGGAPTYVAGLAKWGQAMDFHAKADAAGTAGAAGDYVDCGPSPLFDLVDAMTVGVWVNIRSIPDEWRAIVTKGDSAWRLATNSSTKGFQFAFTGSARGYLGANTSNEVELNEWHYICGTYDKINGAAIYVDGRVRGTNPDKNGIDLDPYNVWIGANSEPMSYKPGRYFDGMLDEVRIYNRALSQPEVVFLAAQ
jgi:hypothetical protein